MSVSPKNGKLLYHLTSLDNVTSIIAHGLLARNGISGFDDVADPEIISFRKENDLNSYVPFHFFPKNPFDGKVQKIYPHKEFIYICVQRTFARLNGFKVIPRHPASMPKLILYDYLEGIEVIEWDIMDIKEYTDPECKQVCMAECLSPVPIKPSDFQSIYVKSNETRDYIESICLKKFNTMPFFINVMKNMFVE